MFLEMRRPIIKTNNNQNLAIPLSQNDFLNLVEENQGIMHKICSLYTSTPEDHQDMYQEIVIQLWRSFSSFRGESKFSTWMYRIALNTAISDLRRQGRRVKVVFPEKPPEQLMADTSYAEKEEQWKQLSVAIQQLGEIEKAIVVLYLEDRSYEEMEEILGINTNNLRVKMNRIKEKLRKLTKEE